MTPFDPKKLLNHTLNSLSYFPIIALGLGLLLTYYIIQNGPLDYRQGAWAKILFLHVPTAWYSLMIYIGLAIMGFLALVTRLSWLHHALQASAYVGFVLTLVTLGSGMIWGSATWGTFWVWDARLSSYALLSIFYLVIILLIHQSPNSQRQRRIVAAIAIFGLTNLILVKLSTSLHNTLHQGTSIGLNKANSFQGDFGLILLLTLIYCGCLLFYIWLVILKKIWEKA